MTDSGWRIVWTAQASGELERLDRRTQQRVLRALERLAATGYGDVKRLRGFQADYRLRVGTWRVLFSRDDTTRTLFVLHVRPRGRAYRG